MSDNPFYHDYMGIGGGINNTFPFLVENPSNYNNQPITPNIQNQQFVPSSYMTLTECLHGSMDYNTLSNAFGMSCSSSSEVVCPHIDNQDSTEKYNVSTTAEEPVLDSPLGDNQTSVEVPPTPNSSISSTSNEVGEQEDSSKIKKHVQVKGSQEEGEDKSKKDKKERRKKDKRTKICLHDKE